MIFQEAVCLRASLPRHNDIDSSDGGRDIFIWCERYSSEDILVMIFQKAVCLRASLPRRPWIGLSPCHWPHWGLPSFTSSSFQFLEYFQIWLLHTFIFEHLFSIWSSPILIFWYLRRLVTFKPAQWFLHPLPPSLPHQPDSFAIKDDSKSFCTCRWGKEINCAAGVFPKGGFGRKLPVWSVPNWGTGRYFL